MKLLKFLKNSTYLIGIISGIGIMLVIWFGYRLVVVNYCTVTLPKFVLDSSIASKKIIIDEKVSQFQIYQLSLEEKIISTNKRLDDIFIFGGIIITLLLAINISVYVKAEGEVEKHFKIHLGEYEMRAEKIIQELERTSAKAQTELELIQKRNSVQTAKIPE